MLHVEPPDFRPVFGSGFRFRVGFRVSGFGLAVGPPDFWPVGDGGREGGSEGGQNCESERVDRIHVDV